jgi:hypothetical protein
MNSMRACVPASRPEEEIHRSLALAALQQELAKNGGYEILDLGAASGVNFDFWSQFSTKLHFADFYASLQSQLRSGASPYEEVFAQVLPFQPQTQFDLILTWDLFNHLDCDALKALIGYLKRYCKPGTILFAMIAFLQSMPSEPRKFKILGPERVLYEAASKDLKPSPRYQPRDVNLLMEGFHPLNSYLLRHGIQEYLFAYD